MAKKPLMYDLVNDRLRMLKIKIRNRVFVREYTYKEIAQESGVCVGTVRKVLSEDGIGHTFHTIEAIALAVEIDRREIEFNSPRQANEIVLTPAQEAFVKRFIDDRRKKRRRRSKKK